MNDEMNRQRALDPNTSFIIQAPAGSGKTELLTQRYLSLLAHVRHVPEEIIAITFTRKAAAEMRQRILNALLITSQHSVASSADPLTVAASDTSGLPLQQITYQLALAALQRDANEQWHILENPNRLRIFTIDALASRISAQMPILAGFGTTPPICEQATPYYQQAVHELLSQLSESSSWQAALSQLLMHLDNRIHTIEQLLINMLARRDQWLPYLLPYRQDTEMLKLQLEASLKRLIDEKLQRLHSLLPSSLLEEWLLLAQEAGRYFATVEAAHPLVSYPAVLTNHLPTTHEFLTTWQALAELLLTQEGQWRKTVDKRQGFPPVYEGLTAAQCKANKARMLQLIHALSGCASAESLRQYLVEITQIPAPSYHPAQWALLTCLIELLPILVSQLRLIFQQHHVIDFVELSFAALQALGDDMAPTDLGLYLDYQIQHLLIDEFQDTSLTQFKLIERLLAGWQTGDGRTIFLVGDPMQSIYRFRNADVSLFLRTQQQGIGSIKLHALQLQRNFRAHASLVEWVNTHFKQILPAEGDITCGAVSYTPVQATRWEQHSVSGVHYHALLSPQPEAEAQRVIEIIQHCQQQQPEATIAILVRARTQLEAIIHTLYQHTLPFEAIAIETLHSYAEIQDLFALTQALLHRGNRLAWFSVLRAPWCGLSLQDLLIIAQASMSTTLWHTLRQFSELPHLSVDAQIRLQRVVPILTHAFKQQGNLSLSEWVESTWMLLGGPATVISTTALERTHTYFQLLDQLTATTPILALDQLENELKRLYATPTQQTETNLQVMTIHKAKGLEFDHVIIPGLAAPVATDPAQLLLWLERPNQAGYLDLMLAPIRASDEQADPLYQYLRHIEKQKLDYECARLLYVAATRAKHSLHLVARLESNAYAEVLRPPTGSFLQMLWLSYHTYFQQAATPLKNNDATNTLLMSSLTSLTQAPMLQRLVADWKLPPLATKPFSLP